MTAFSRLTLLLALVFGEVRWICHPMAASTPSDVTTAQRDAAPPALPGEDLARRTDPYGRAFAEMKLPPEKIRRLRELIAVSHVAPADLEGEVMRGAYRSRQEAIEVFSLACAEAETEITHLLTPLQYARFTTARDELPARVVVAAFDTALTAEVPPTSPLGAVTAFTDDVFESLVAIVQSSCHRHRVLPDNTLPPDLTDEPALTRYLAAKTAANREIATGASTLLSPAQIAAVQHYQAAQLEALSALWHHPPTRSWAQRR